MSAGVSPVTTSFVGGQVDGEGAFGRGHRLEVLVGHVDRHEVADAVEDRGRVAAVERIAEQRVAAAVDQVAGGGVGGEGAGAGQVGLAVGVGDDQEAVALNGRGRWARWCRSATPAWRSSGAHRRQRRRNCRRRRCCRGRARRTACWRPCSRWCPCWRCCRRSPTAWSIARSCRTRQCAGRCKDSSLVPRHTGSSGPQPKRAGLRGAVRRRSGAKHLGKLGKDVEARLGGRAPGGARRRCAAP